MDSGEGSAVVTFGFGGFVWAMRARGVMEVEQLVSAEEVLERSSVAEPGGARR